ncbi:hypothetical protein HYG77_04695 [Rhodococcus sp. ZPP]|uniref:hypothetical protein n=1 Tax=Rhodococcus sp. ZPP TaxID=2749906 RepID=UPI001AD8955B|nr:hypothetical protein [Rhodococcus sp. ZPP]QTJ64964.1 hypothetical protein HYG77_04695 [Rhodococcus sp. ZPP]
MSGHVYNGTTWERVKTMHVWNGTVFEQVKEAWRWTGSGWELLYAVPVAIFDDFNRANSSTIGGPWVKYGTNSAISSNSYATSGTSDGSRGIVTSSQINTDDGYVEAVLGGAIAPNGNADTSIMARVNAAGTVGLSANFYSDRVYLSKFSDVSGLTAGYDSGMTDIASNTSVSFASGDTVRLEFEGDNYVVRKNGTAVITTSDASVTRGPGQRYGAIRVERAPFNNSCAINSFKIADIGA